VNEKVVSLTERFSEQKEHFNVKFEELVKRLSATKLVVIQQKKWPAALEKPSLSQQLDRVKINFERRLDRLDNPNTNLERRVDRLDKVTTEFEWRLDRIEIVDCRFADRSGKFRTDMDLTIPVIRASANASLRKASGISPLRTVQSDRGTGPRAPRLRHPARRDEPNCACILGGARIYRKICFTID
jgi:hypothetical protein